LKYTVRDVGENPISVRNRTKWTASATQSSTAASSPTHETQMKPEIRFAPSSGSKTITAIA
jgi:hypothetical protein